MYSYVSGEATDLIFNSGDVILVSKTEGDWWTGSIGDKTGVFPANYVKKMEVQVNLKMLKYILYFMVVTEKPIFFRDTVFLDFAVLQ